MIKHIKDSLRESILADDILDDHEKKAAILYWTQHYKDRYLKEGKHYTIQKIDGEYYVEFLNDMYDVCDLGHTAGLNTINIKFPKRIGRLTMLYEDYMTPSWIKDKFDGVEIRELILDLTINPTILDLDILNSFPSFLTEVEILCEGNPIQILFPKKINCDQLYLLRASNIKFKLNNHIPCNRIIIGRQ